MTKQKTREKEDRWLWILVIIVIVVLSSGIILSNKREESYKQQLSECQDEVGVLENIQLTPTTVSYWQWSKNGYNNYVCVGSFYINGNKFEVPKGVEIGFWNRTPSEVIK